MTTAADLSKTKKPLYRRIVLKFSGELLANDTQRYDPAALKRAAQEIIAVRALGCHVAVMVGGGNLLRGRDCNAIGIDPIVADHAGMLATTMNALLFADVLQQHGMQTELLGGIAVEKICALFSWQKARRALDDGRVVLLAGGTGNPLFTTDTGAVLRAVEIGADAVCKITTVEGVYSKDPKHHRDATLYRHIDFDTVLQKQLAVMDIAAVTICKAHKLPVHVCTLGAADTVAAVISGEPIGTIIGTYDHD